MGIKKALLRTIVISAIALAAGCASGKSDRVNRLGGGNAAFDSSFTDHRDGQVYRTVKIGKDTWMAENLNYKTDSSWCYDNADSTCAKYGRLYNWKTAKSVCPTGWHLPSFDDCNDLAVAAHGTWRVLGPIYFSYEGTAGKRLKSTSGWSNVGYYAIDDNGDEIERDGEEDGGVRVDNGNGTDALGFSALPGGMRHRDGSFSWVGRAGFFWSTWDDDLGSAFRLIMHFNVDEVDFFAGGIAGGHSVRCVQNALKSE